MLRNVFAIALAIALGVSAFPQSGSTATLPSIRIILVGDSTMAPRNGWGPGFCDDVVAQVDCVNMAKNGRSSKSYRAEGSWAQVMDALKHNNEYKATYVFVQFGHNDQPGKPGRSTNLATEFPANMRGYVEDIRSTGAQPVLITPLSRRQFKNGKLDNTLAPWADATRGVAEETHVPVLELNADSAAAVQAMGQAKADSLAMAPPTPEEVAAESTGTSAPLLPKPRRSTAAMSTAAQNVASEPKGPPPPVFDYTHLGPKGSAYFAQIVVKELDKAVPALRSYLKQ